MLEVSVADIGIFLIGIFLMGFGLGMIVTSLAFRSLFSVEGQNART